MGGYHSQRHRLSDENFSTMLEMSPYNLFFRWTPEVSKTKQTIVISTTEDMISHHIFQT